MYKDAHAYCSEAQIMLVTHDPTSWMTTVGCDRLLVGKSCRLSYLTNCVVYKLDAVEWSALDSNGVISSLLEKYNIIRAHETSSHLTWV